MFQKVLIFSLFSIFCEVALANSNEITVFLAPIFKFPSRNSIVLDRVKKGSTVLLRNQDLIISDDDSEDSFFKVITRKGVIGYILEGHSQDKRLSENTEEKFDETDYSKRMEIKHRPQETLYSSKFLFLGSTPKNPQAKSKEEIQANDQSFSQGFAFTFSKKITSTKRSNLRIGGALRYFYDKGSFLSNTNAKFTESLSSYSIGPTFIYKTKKILGLINEVQLGPTINLSKLTISNNNLNSNYQSLSPGIHLSNYLSIKDIIPYVDFIFGLSFDVNFLKIKRKNNVSFNEIRDVNSMTNPYLIQGSAVFGFQINQ